MRRFGQFAPAFLAILALVFCGTGRAEAGTFTFAGSSSGCFNCTSGGSSTATVGGTGGLTFNSATFADISPDASGSTEIDLGTLGLGLSSYNYSRNHTSLLLSVTFTDPGSISGSYAATIEGSVNRLGNGTVNVQLDNSYQTFNFSNAAGYGSFDFGILDPTLHLKPGDTLMLWGVIQNLQYTAIPPPDTGTGDSTGGGADSNDPSQPVPEPMTLLLFGCGVAAALRRRAIL
jgi:hypothetical protein